LDADLAAAFDKISHSFLLAQLGSFPARDMIAAWLRAGAFEAGKGFAPTEEGTPQGGIISPLLLNVALHGLEEAAGVRYRTGLYAEKVRNGSPVLVRYADDFVACCLTRQQAESVRERLTGWLAERGLSFNTDKTRIVHLTQGFDLLSWTFRRYPSSKLLIKPSRAAVRKHRKRLADEMRRLRGSNAVAVIATISPIIRGSPGVLSPLHDVAVKRFTESFCNTSAKCGARCRRCSEPCRRGPATCATPLTIVGDELTPLRPARSAGTHAMPVLHPERRRRWTGRTGRWRSRRGRPACASSRRRCASAPWLGGRRVRPG